jgi:hypothetical protein
LAGLSVLWGGFVTVGAADRIGPFLQQHCVECHDAEMKKGGLDLTALAPVQDAATNLTAWSLVHDRVASG